MAQGTQANGDPGSLTSYVLGTQEGWGAFNVVRWHAIEEISSPFEYDITFVRAAALGPLDQDEILDEPATLRIRTQTRWRSVHGIIAEAEEIDRSGSLIVYRILLTPPIWRAKYRRRCRNFVDWTLAQIVEAVLMNVSPAHPDGLGGLVQHDGDVDPPDEQPSFASFEAPRGEFRWAVGKRDRIDSPAVYPYVVQYNETDFDFVSRLLEHEGLSYYFEHTDGAVVMTLTDAPGQAPPFAAEGKAELRGLSTSGQTDEHEYVRWLRDARRLRSRASKVREFDWHRSQRPLEAESVGAGAGDRDLRGAFEFPGGHDLVTKNPCVHPAQIRLERFDVERDTSEGSSNVKSLEPGRALTITDAAGLRRDVELVLVRVETYAVELTFPMPVLDEEPFSFNGGPAPAVATYENRFLAIPSTAMFRPAMRTPEPRIHGVQSAIVTAEEQADEGERLEINTDKNGCVRVRFPWDQRSDVHDGTPTSCWIRVSQGWAGSSFGALYTPRVGHEVLVAYHQGAPERPVIVGRVYNVQKPPPYNPAEYPTRSTLKSHSSPAAEGFNEIRFEDAATLEEIYVHAQRDLNEVVLASHSTNVGGSQSNTVGGDRTHSVGGAEAVAIGDDRTTRIKKNEWHKVEGFRNVHVLVNEEHAVDGFRKTHVGANDEHQVDGFRKTHIVANEEREVDNFRRTNIGANDALTVGGWRNTDVHGGDTVKVKAARRVDVGADHTQTAGGSFASEAKGRHLFKSPELMVEGKLANFQLSDGFFVSAAGCTLVVSQGNITLNNGAGASISLTGGKIYIQGGAIDVKADSTVDVDGSAINLGK